MLGLLLAILVLDDCRPDVRVHIVPVARDVLYTLLTHRTLHFSGRVHMDHGFDGRLEQLILQLLLLRCQVGRTVCMMLNVRIVFLRPKRIQVRVKVMHFFLVHRSTLRIHFQLRIFPHSRLVIKIDVFGLKHVYPFAVSKVARRRLLQVVLIMFKDYLRRILRRYALRFIINFTL